MSAGLVLVQSVRGRGHFDRGLDRHVM